MFAAAALALPLSAAAPIELNGFALLRAAPQTSGTPFDNQPVSAQLHLGLDWRPSVTFGTHVQLLARDDPEGSRRGNVGIVQAYAEANIPRGDDRFRVMAGAFFLPTSRENVDALWETPYTITPSALNSWFGEEFRPIGLDLSYTARRALTVGGTVFRGNDTFGAFLADRGWALRDHWALLGEHLPSNSEYFTSVSAENDGRLGWSGRVRWNNNYATVQATHVDNRADGLEYPQGLLNWGTRFDMLSFDFTRNDWTLAGETLRGETTVTVHGSVFPTDIRTTYILVSRLFGSVRASVRAEEFDALNSGTAFTAAVLWSPRGKLRTGVELIRSGDETRLALELRYHFSSIFPLPR